MQHNHEIGSSVIKHYASNRKLSMQEQLELNEVLELRPNNKQLKDYVHPLEIQEGGYIKRYTEYEVVIKESKSKWKEG